MASTYYAITLTEMENFLKPEKGWKKEICGNEFVFLFVIPSRPELTIKVFSGIKSDSLFSRDCGKDALRVACINTTTNRGWIKSGRCNRVIGWQANLKAKILQVITDAKNRKF
jgi:hypothetical protein